MYRFVPLLRQEQKFHHISLLDVVHLDPANVPFLLFEKSVRLRIKSDELEIRDRGKCGHEKFTSGVLSVHDLN
jgi:hypothetical protein